MLIILLSVMIFQIVRIKVEKSRYEALVAECETYKELIAKGEDTIEARTSYWWLVERARELGYVFDGDHIYQ